VVWLIMLYVSTAVTAGAGATPEGDIALILFELRHVALHLLAFSIEGWLIANALRLPADSVTMRSGIWLIVVVLTLGIGQEALQGLYRNEVRVLASLWDLAVDATGGAIGWWWHKHRHTGPLSRYFKGVRTES
jgi:hypothetical protein